MARLGLTVCLLNCFGLCALSGCCFLLPHERVTVRDAETGAPVANAHVNVARMGMLFPSCSNDADTDEHGVATLSVSGGLVFWRLNATGYLPESTLGAQTQSDGSEFRIYKEPTPRVNIIVPDNYRGPLKIELIEVAGWVQQEVGRREFTFKASRTGFVRIYATPLLLRLKDPFGVELQARFANGRAIPEQDYRIGPTDVALRYILID